MTILILAALWLTIAALTALGVAGFIGACHDDRARERRAPLDPDVAAAIAATVAAVQHLPVEEACERICEAALVAETEAWLKEHDTGMVRTRIDNHSWTVAEADWPGDAEHIASWHPAVALAVADWLESVAGSCVPPPPESAPDVVDAGRHICEADLNHALAVANAYLGDPA